MDMEIALMQVLSPRYNSTPYELIEYPMVNVAIDIPSPIEQSIDIQALAFQEPYTEEEHEYYVTHL